MVWYFEVLKKYAVLVEDQKKRILVFRSFQHHRLYHLGVIDGVTGTLDPESGMGLLGLISLAILIPALAVSVRRLHDTGRSGWWLLILLILLSDNRDSYLYGARQ